MDRVPGWTRLGPFEIHGGGTLTKGTKELVWEDTGCIVQAKVFKEGKPRELKVWGPPDRVSDGYKAGMKFMVGWHWCFR